MSSFTVVKHYIDCTHFCKSGATMTALWDVVQSNAIPALVSSELVGVRPLHLAAQDRSVA